ncbi:hypothetical protein SSBR45G_08630 [Bradyrhizobium sp. SSBR45G]|uniref:DUF1963 domain-containing protein n=1 Tax=unclassified Bradyrhizobium TaxID=2631580 RepID=UPI002342BA02|nr:MULTISPECIES: DUF1963 domain-containing protein [unclassified Bradyrhizobium]GLH75955.1 hypothetical protein SSBR45G_08630 [Bradyrhizobium sp. SSBR45G]GLH85192.1 hypothetical protein SSBR45R_26520 [Bradyrhizobium sp. SSBR45R]
MREEADWLDRTLAFLAAFFVTGIALVFAWALIETVSPVRIQADALRNSFPLLIGLAAIGMGWRSARNARGRAGTTMSGGARQPPARNLAWLENERSHTPAMPPVRLAPMDADVRRAIDAARRGPIVFRELYPPPADPGLSFYGGLPIGPPDLTWPSKQSDGAPLHFVMQWDCASLAAVDPTGLLPRDGVLFLFCDLEWREPMPFRFIHRAGDPQSWGPLPMPANLGPVFGSQGVWRSPYTSSLVPEEEQDAPRLLPRWPFRPVALAYSTPTTGDEDPRFWIEEAAENALLEAQNALGAPLATSEPARHVAFGRPFARFPQDWAAVRVVCAAAIEKLSGSRLRNDRHFMTDTDSAARQATIDRWLSEAKALYVRASNNALVAALPADQADAIWAWVETISQTFYLGFDRIVEHSVNASLGLGSDGVAVIPSELIARVSLQHSLARAFMREEYQHEFVKRHGQALTAEEAKARFEIERAAGTLPRLRSVSASNPNRIFGPPSYVQGNVEEQVEDWLLLLELHSEESIGMPMGEGVMQFLIRPDDLRQGRFEKVDLILTAY